MTTNCTIRGIPVSFPYEPYPLQTQYMEKVIDCLQNEENGILESPTGTGKTLALLCSSLAWLSVKKAQMKMHMQTNEMNEANEFIKSLNEQLNEKVGASAKNTGNAFFHLPTIIYASRTHSQLTQAMQELKRTAYCHMKATVIGSREQMCIHPEIIKEENNSAKVHMCRLKVLTRSCHFYNRVERQKNNPSVKDVHVMDIEDLVTLGKTHKFCPYFMSRELKQESDIVFMPYNYLLDPKSRKALGIELSNNIVILDEAHNVDKMCEESASLQIKSTDIALCIDEVTEVMKAMNENSLAFLDDNVPKDFCEKELCDLKEILLNFEKVLDGIEIKQGIEMTTFDGNYIFEILSKAGIHDNNFAPISHTMDKIIQFLSAVNNGPFQRKGNGLQLLADLLLIVFTSVSVQYRDKIQKCYKIHIMEEDQKRKTVGSWLTKPQSKKGCRILSYWCFSPGFGMSSLLRQGIKTVILTSGTLAPLQPLICELEINVGVRLENPHIVTKNQVCVKIISKGPDDEPLNCSYQNRTNPRFISSLGRSILNFTRMIPDGLLIFYPSYPILKQCQDHWQEEGIWTNIHSIKPIYVEPRDKETFTLTMAEYYAKIKDPTTKGAIFMGVCRGKISEGLDFADINGRAVIIIGLPYPPLKDPKVILKKRYLDMRHSSNKQYLRGDEWYSLEATRAVNQAMGRVIRHKNDYGAILLLDARFNSSRITSQMSAWLRERIEVASNFGTIMREMRLFFKNAEAMFPLPDQKASKPIESNVNTSVPAEFDVTNIYKQNLFNFSSSTSSAPGNSSNSNLVTIHKRNPKDVLQNFAKKKKIMIVANNTTTNEINGPPLETTTKEYITMVQKALSQSEFQEFLAAIKTYHQTGAFDEFTRKLDAIFVTKPDLIYIIGGLSHYIKADHKDLFEEYWSKVR